MDKGKTDRRGTVKDWAFEAFIAFVVLALIVPVSPWRGVFLVAALLALGTWLARRGTFTPRDRR